MTTTTFDQYVLNFRDELQSAARDCLNSLELRIKDEGDDWLEAHFESLFSASASGPIVEHLKTPSRTATAKKTRARLEADKQRTDKVKSVNAKLGMVRSPSAHPSPARLLFQSSNSNSPLQPRTVNNAPAAAVSPSPIKSKASKALGNAGHENGTSTPRRLAAALSPTRPSPITRASVRSPPAPTAAATAARVKTPTPAPVQSPTRPTKSPLRQATSPVTRVRSPPVPALALRSPKPSTSTSSRSAPTPAPVHGPLNGIHKDLSMIMEGNSERSAATANGATGIARNAGGAKSPVPVRTRPQSPRSAKQVTSPRSPPRAVLAHQPSIDALIAPAPPPAPAPAQVPVRAVRSSWLSKALTSGAVPVNAHAGSSDHASALRKSVVPQAPHSQARPTLHNDFAGLRKSLVPPNGLKRKSDEADIDDDEQDEREKQSQPTSVRPAKTVKVETPTVAAAGPPKPSKPVFERQPSNPSSSSAASAGPPAAPAPVSAPAPVQMQIPSEISKVTKALEDIKERTQAKELAKQKAAALAGTSARANANPTTGGGGGTGFFRGLTKSLGLGVGGKVETPEEEAERLQRELEEDRKAEAEAQAELDRLMNEVLTPAPAAESAPAPAPVVRSTTPVATPPTVGPLPPQPASDEDETDDEEEESEVIEALDIAEIVSAPARAPAPATVAPKPAAAAASQTPRLATPPRMSGFDVRLSTTPAMTPPQPKAKQPANDRSSSAKPNKQAAPAEVAAKPQQSSSKKNVVDTAEDVDMSDNEMELEEAVVQHVKVHTKSAASSTRPILTSSATSSAAPLALTSQGLLNQASTIAAKTLGVKPATAPIKSVQLAQAAAKKEQDAAARKQTFREQAEARRLEANRKKADEERARAIEAERVRQQEIERGQKLRAELDRKKAEREEKMATAMKQQAERQQKEAAAAKAKAAEEEANRKRKMAPMLNKSSAPPTGNPNPAKRPAPGPAQTAGNNKARDTFRPTSSVKGSSAAQSQTAPKLGPTSFRTAPAAPHVQAQAESTIRLVNANPAHLGPPSRPSAATHPHPQWSHVPTNPNAGASTVLQQQRVALQSQLDVQNYNGESEDIVLPDIASEYSDSNDSEKSTDFKRPEWAESPELRAALERQATRNPDELFGPIKPISMEELFKVKVNKFRPRSSSANWASGDGVTRKEELDYARRMGFKSLNPRGEGSSAGAGAGGSGSGQP